MSGFSDKSRSFVTMMRAALGDFDVATIDENSPDTFNLCAFLFCLLGVQFIMLSMVFSILGEAQAVIIARNREQELEELSEQLDLASKFADEMDENLTKGFKRLTSLKTSFNIFGNKNEVVPEANPESKDKEKTDEKEDKDENLDVLEDNPHSPRVIKQQMEDLRRELKGLTALIEERYLNIDNPDCLEVEDAPTSQQPASIPIGGPEPEKVFPVCE